MTESRKGPTRGRQPIRNDTVHPQHNDKWSPALTLEAPEPRAGFAQRWVRILEDGKPDWKNIMRRKREGWKPRPADSAPDYQTTKFGDDQVIGNEENVLMERPIEMHEEQVNYVRGQSRRQMEAVHSNVYRDTGRGGGGFGPVRYDEDKTGVTTGRPAPVADDPAL